MSPKNYQSGVWVSEGVEKCPGCGALLDWEDRFNTMGEGEDMIHMWSCHACGHPFRTWRGEVLMDNHWPVKTKEGTFRVELAKI